MGRMDDLRKLRDQAAGKLQDPALREQLAAKAGDAVVAASGAVDGAHTVAERSGLTTKQDKISKLKVARAALHAPSTAANLLSATADEVKARRNNQPTDAPVVD